MKRQDDGKGSNETGGTGGTGVSVSATSSPARDAILGRIKQSLLHAAGDLAQTPGKEGESDAGQNEDERLRAVNARLTKHEVQSTLVRVDIPRPELIALFRSFLEGQAARVIDVDAKADIPATVAEYLRANNMPPRLRMGIDPYLADLDWSLQSNLTLDTGPSTADDSTGLSHAITAAAETGTLYLASGADNPVTINFLPDTHIVVVRQRDIVGSYENAWDQVRARYGEGIMPRTLNMISGPSRTADIAGVLVRGAHGPKDLCVIIVKDD